MVQLAMKDNIFKNTYKIQCHYAADPRVASLNPGRVYPVNPVSSSVVAVGASRWLRHDGCMVESQT